MPQIQKLKEFFSAFQKENRFLGLDIGASSIKLVQLRKEKEMAVLETYGELSLATYGGGDVGRAVMVVEGRLKIALSDLIKEAKVTAKGATVSVPLKNSFFTTMRLPRLSDQELKESIQYEARKYIPVPISEVIVEWWVLSPTGKEVAETSIGTGTRNFLEVFLSAIPKDVVENRSSLLGEAGLEALSFEIESFSFARASLKRNLGTVLLIDIGASSTKFAIADGGAVRAVHHLEKGSQDMTLGISQSLGVDFERAEAMKREYGISNKPETEGIVQVLAPMVDFIVLEGERFLLDWKRRGGDTIGKVLVGGGGALLKNINDVIIKRYGVEAETVSPFSKVVYPAFLEPSLREIGPSFANAIGLALKNF